VVSIRLDNGAVIGAYQIDGLLAEGGMGVVYRARQVALDLPVALKVIRPEWAHDDDFRARFKREARLAASLHHPNVVSPHDFGDHEGQLFVVMPLIPGTDLGSVIEQEGPCRRRARPT
jgi:eukaryotic-like serine/threonine-protein kinase